MKINCALISRSLIALLFVVAGVQKIMNFAQVSGYIGSLGVPVPMVATLLVILVEVPVALSFAWGYEVRYTGYILIAFTVIATLLVHKNYFGSDMVMVLKNIAIIGGIVSCVGCLCGSCSVDKRH